MLCVSRQGICMIIGGLKHSEQRFNSRSAGVSSSLLFISVGGEHTHTNKQTNKLALNIHTLQPSFQYVLYLNKRGLTKLCVRSGVFAPTLFSKAYGRLVCEGCSITPGNITGPFSCKNCHYDLV